MKRYLATLIAVVLTSAAMLGGSALALNDEETIPETSGETSAESGFTDDTVEDSIQQEPLDTVPEVKEPVTLENLSPEARANIDDEFYEKLQNADEDEVFDVSVVLESKDRWLYKSTYAVDEYDWESFYSKDYFSYSSTPTIYEIEYYGWEYGWSKDMLIYYAEQAKALLDEYDFLKSGRFSVNWELGEICYLKLNKSQILAIIGNENVETIYNCELVGCDC